MRTRSSSETRRAFSHTLHEFGFSLAETTGGKGGREGGRGVVFFFFEIIIMGLETCRAAIDFPSLEISSSSLI